MLAGIYVRLRLVTPVHRNKEEYDIARTITHLPLRNFDWVSSPFSEIDGG